MIDAVDTRGRRGERLPCPVVACMTRSGDDEGLAGDTALEDVDADARAAVVVKAGVPRLPPAIEPGFRVVVTPQKLERSLSDLLERPEHDQPGSRARELRALFGREVVVAQRQAVKAGLLGHGAILHRSERFRTAGR